MRGSKVREQRTGTTHHGAKGVHVIRPSSGAVQCAHRGGGGGGEGSGTIFHLHILLLTAGLWNSCPRTWRLRFSFRATSARLWKVLPSPPSTVSLAISSSVVFSVGPSRTRSPDPASLSLGCGDTQRLRELCVSPALVTPLPALQRQGTLPRLSPWVLEAPRPGQGPGAKSPVGRSITREPRVPGPRRLAAFRETPCTPGNT